MGKQKSVKDNNNEEELSSDNFDISKRKKLLGDTDVNTKQLEDLQKNVDYRTQGYSIDTERPDLIGAITPDIARSEHVNEILENRRGINQSGLEQTVNAVRNFGVTTASTVVGTGLTLGSVAYYGAKALIPSTDVKWQDVIDNDAVRGLDKLSEEWKGKQYYSDEEKDNFFDMSKILTQVTDQAGFVAGAYISGGLTAGALTRFGLSGTREILGLAKLAKYTAMGDEAGVLAMGQAKNIIKKQIFNAAQKTAISSLDEGAMALSARSKQTFDALMSAQKAGTAITASTIGSTYESGLQYRMWSEENEPKFKQFHIDKGIENYKRENNTDVVPEDIMAQIEENAGGLAKDDVLDGAFGVFGGNLALLSVNDYITFGRNFTSGFKATSKAVNMEKRINQLSRSLGAEGEAMVAKSQGIVLAPINNSIYKNMYNTVAKGVKAVGGYTKVNTREMFEEMSQTGLDNVFSDYALTKYDENGIKKTNQTISDYAYNFLGSIASGTEKTIKSRDAWEGGMYGFIMGAYTGSISKSADFAKGIKPLQSERDELLGILKAKENFRAGVKGALQYNMMAQDSKIQDDMNNGLLVQDEFKHRNAATLSLMNQVKNAYDMGLYEGMIDDIRQLQKEGQNDPGKYKTTFGVSSVTSDGKNALDKTIEQMEGMRKIVEHIDMNLGVVYEGNENQTELTRAYRDKLIATAVGVKDLRTREGQMKAAINDQLMKYGHRLVDDYSVKKIDEFGYDSQPTDEGETTFKMVKGNIKGQISEKDKKGKFEATKLKYDYNAADLWHDVFNDESIDSVDKQEILRNITDMHRANIMRNALDNNYNDALSEEGIEAFGKQASDRIEFAYDLLKHNWDKIKPIPPTNEYHQPEMQQLEIDAKGAVAKANEDRDAELANANEEDIPAINAKYDAIIDDLNKNIPPESRAKPSGTLEPLSAEEEGVSKEQPQTQYLIRNNQNIGEAPIPVQVNENGKPVTNKEGIVGEDGNTYRYSDGYFIKPIHIDSEVLDDERHYIDLDEFEKPLFFGGTSYENTHDKTPAGIAKKEFAENAKTMPREELMGRIRVVATKEGTATKGKGGITKIDENTDEETAMVAGNVNKNTYIHQEQGHNIVVMYTDNNGREHIIMNVPRVSKFSDSKTKKPIDITKIEFPEFVKYFRKKDRDFTEKEFNKIKDDAIRLSSFRNKVEDISKGNKGEDVDLGNSIIEPYLHVTKGQKNDAPIEEVENRIKNAAGRDIEVSEETPTHIQYKTVDGLAIDPISVTRIQKADGSEQVIANVSKDDDKLLNGGVGFNFDNFVEQEQAVPEIVEPVEAKEEPVDTKTQAPDLIKIKNYIASLEIVDC